jgi:predicted site-specific integrase-resolvase
MKPLSTNQVAKAVGVHSITLEKWLAQGKIKQPKKLMVGERIVRLWSEADVGRITKYKQENYRKGRGRKPKPKQ